MKELEPFRNHSHLAEPCWRSGRSSYLPGVYFIVENSSDFRFPSSSAKLKRTHISVFIS